VIAELDARLTHVLVHTGQNFDAELNQIFFDELEIRKPDYSLEIASETPAQAIANVIAKADEVLAKENPDALLLLGDTNSCLSAIAAKRRKVPIFHMEAGTAASTSAPRRKLTGGSSTTSATSICPTPSTPAATFSPKV